MSKEIVVCERVCPVCGGELEYFGGEPSDNNTFFYTVECKNKCGFKGKEWYNLVFSGFNDSDGKQYDTIKKLVRIFMRGGLLVDVDNLPVDIGYKLIDYDDLEHNDITDHSCGMCKHSETCEVDIGEPGCNYVYVKQEEVDKKAVERQSLELKAKEILLNQRREDIIADILQELSIGGLREFVKTGGVDYKFGLFVKVKKDKV